MDADAKQRLEAIRKKVELEEREERCPNCSGRDFELEHGWRTCKCGARWTVWAANEKNVKQWP